ncbi:MAG: PepSY domain-containing protein [Oscillospiraceae bacterium]|nr:PepSY domain-containing protein [Oscillospiraceae bacterium]
MRKIKKTLKQCDSLPLPNKEEFLSSLGCYEPKETEVVTAVSVACKPRSVHRQFIPMYSALALVLVLSIGFVVYNHDKLFGTDVTPPVASDTTPVTISTPPVASDTSPVTTATPPDTTETPGSQIAEEEAAQIALERAGGGTITSNELDTQKGVLVYKVVIVHEGIKHSMSIDVATGEIIKYKTKGDETANVEISQEQAEQIALERAGGGNITDIELDTKKGVLVWEIEVFHNGFEHEMDIDAATGEIVKYKFERSSDMLDNASVDISIEEAEQIALAEVSSRFGSGGVVIESELDSKNGTFIYEVEIFLGGVEYEVEIDAMSGEVVGFEVD